MTSPTTTPTRWAHGRPDRGLTLVELLVVLTIIAVVSAVVVPRFGGKLSRTRVRQAALTLAEHVRYAQALAIDKERPVRVSFERNARGYRVELAESVLGLEFQAAPGVSGTLIGLPEGVQFGQVSVEPGPDGVEDTLWFDPAGSGSFGQVQVSDGEYGYEVRIGRGLGRVEAVELGGGDSQQASDSPADGADPGT